MLNPTFSNSSLNSFIGSGADVPMPYAQSLEACALPQAKDVVAAAKKTLGVKWSST